MRTATQDEPRRTRQREKFRMTITRNGDACSSIIHSPRTFACQQMKNDHRVDPNVEEHIFNAYMLVFPQTRSLQTMAMANVLTWTTARSAPMTNRAHGRRSQRHGRPEVDHNYRHQTLRVVSASKPQKVVYGCKPQSVFHGANTHRVEWRNWTRLVCERR